MAWLVTGIGLGIMPHILSDEVAKGASRARTNAFVFWIAPAIGGMVMVGKMLVWELCEDFAMGDGHDEEAGSENAITFATHSTILRLTLVGVQFDHKMPPPRKYSKIFLSLLAIKSHYVMKAYQRRFSSASIRRRHHIALDHKVF